MFSWKTANKLLHLQKQTARKVILNKQQHSTINIFQNMLIVETE